MTNALDHALLAARIMRPKRGDTWPAKKLLRGITDPEAAWTALATLLPPALATQPTRRFQKPFVLPVDATAATPTPGQDLTPSPPTMAACFAVATDAAGILAVEGHAREAMKRLAPWGVRPRENVIWTFVPEWPGADQGGEHVFDAVHMSLQRAADGKKKAEIGLRASYKSGAQLVTSHLSTLGTSVAALQLCQRFIDAAGLASQWQRACELGLPVPPYEHAPGKIVPAAGTPFADLPDPFEPLVALMLLGYWLSGATDDAIVLVGTELSSQP
jgi:hypothetical protein